MRLLIASDIHGAARAAKRLVDAFRAEGADQLVLLGDILYHGPRNDLPDDYAPKRVIELLNGIADHIICVRGNCEAEVDQMVLDFSCLSTSNTLVDAECGRNLFLTHGHVFGPGVEGTSDRLPALRPGDIVLFGHTHVKVHMPCPARGDLVCFNPGSAGIPKDGSASYGIYDNGRLSHHLLG